MDTEQRWKRKRIGKNYCVAQRLSSRSLFFCFTLLFLFSFFFSNRRLSLRTASFRPVLTASSTTLSRLSTSASKSILDSLTRKLSPIRIQHRILFPDHLLLIAVNRFNRNEKLECFYNISTREILKLPALSTAKYDEFRSVSLCPLPPINHSISTVELRRRGGVHYRDGSRGKNKPVHLWDKVVYEAALDGNTALVFAKGLNLRPHKVSDPNEFRCHFYMGNSVVSTKAITAAQEVVRCKLPKSFMQDSDKLTGVKVTISHGRANSRAAIDNTLPSVARIFNPNLNDKQETQKKYQICACTMVWNQAASLREWIMYHAWLGVERCFIYDNNSNDDIEDVIEELNLQGYNISRQTWPWIKAQEAGFSHCALRARDECKWVGFFDVDEFFYFSYKHRLYETDNLSGRNALQSLIANFSSMEDVAEIRTACHNFGPSGLTSIPAQGVTVGYTCRLQNSERHKSFVRPDLLDPALLNVVHHFVLKDKYRFVNVPESSANINHYKYQVWEVFQSKFKRRVSTYVVDWQEDQNQGSKDRAPGLGTEAIEPPDWRRKFCEVWDTGMRDYVTAYFTDPVTRLLPWERTTTLF